MVKWTNHARNQLRQIHDFIAQDSAHYAKRVVDDLVKKSMNLDKLPNRGRVVSEFNQESVREISVYTYRILYEIKPDHISVLAVIHKRRHLQADDIYE
ncbi:type II toxin-antitoxin system RelE/ParE family toxin [Methylomonas paludis]|uniref:Type II toxin-antitoxin system RelE/ParE family toxin n=1 Tax=Methylomonas paludis TaxID=1173101 RepID=A0A975R8F3_9GAMM|nr:type II toxin-antitoxin system RelE/ParE family toxin [Methylomonas paludis]QWF70325.1 type II toxin-antitoxin system RelE/ParE family toxin [Methylomonas paludis]